MNATILVLGGDGIGPEVTAAAERVVRRVAEQANLEMTFEHALVGGASYDLCGEFISDATMAKARAADAILFGSEGGPKWDSIDLQGEPEKRSGLTRLRRQLELYANLRPIRPMSCLMSRSTLKAEVLQGVDFVILRELCGGNYFGRPRGISRTENGQLRGFETQSYTDREIERIARTAFTLARSRRNRVTSVDKANVMESGFLWRQTVTRLHQDEYGDVELRHMYADNAAMQIIREPRQFDVLVTDNLFGDILSDGAAMITGSLGMLPSAAIGDPRPSGAVLGLYEPIHGSATELAGKDIANPIGAILSAAMMFTHSLRRPDLGRRIDAAVERALEAGARTADLGGSASATGMTNAVLEQL
jgi:3-isopropylmalate dehydrogenase